MAGDCAGLRLRKPGHRWPLPTLNCFVTGNPDLKTRRHLSLDADTLVQCGGRAEDPLGHGSSIGSSDERP